MKKLAQFDIGNALKLGGSRDARSLGNLGTIASNVLPNLYVAAGIVMFFFLIFAGLKVIMGAGGENPEKLQKAKQTLTWALIGFLVISGSYWIIQILRVLTGINLLNLSL